MREWLACGLLLAVSGCTAIIDSEIETTRQRERPDGGGTDAGGACPALSCVPSTPLAIDPTSVWAPAVAPLGDHFLVAFSNLVDGGRQSVVELHEVLSDGDAGPFQASFPSSSISAARSTAPALGLATLGDLWAVAWVDPAQSAVYCTASSLDAGIQRVDGAPTFGGANIGSVTIAFAGDGGIDLAVGTDAPALYIGSPNGGCPQQFFQRSSAPGGVASAQMSPSGSDDGVRFLTTEMFTGGASHPAIAVWNTGGSQLQRFPTDQAYSDMGSLAVTPSSDRSLIFSVFSGFLADGGVELRSAGIPSDLSTLTFGPVLAQSSTWWDTRECGPGCLATVSLPDGNGQLVGDVPVVFSSDAFPYPVLDRRVLACNQPLQPASNQFGSTVAVAHAGNRLGLFFSTPVAGPSGLLPSRLFLCQIPNPP